MTGHTPRPHTLHLQTGNCTRALNATGRYVCTVATEQQPECPGCCRVEHADVLVVAAGSQGSHTRGKEQPCFIFGSFHDTHRLLTCCGTFSGITFTRLCPCPGAGTPAASAHEDATMT